MRNGMILSCALLLACGAGCGAAEDVAPTGENESTASTQEAITGGWTDLALTNGWQSYWGTALKPAVGKINGVVTFRGALKATNPTNGQPFTITDPNLFPDGALNLPVAMANGSMGTLALNPIAGVYVASVQQDSTGTVPGANAKILTSLDGAAYDTVKGAALSTAWYDFYPYRVQDGAFAKSVDATAGGSNAFVRMQGFVCKVDGCSASNDLNGYLFTLPSNLRPGQTVFVPTHLGLGVGTNTGSWGMLSIYSSGEVYVNGNPFMANIGTSLEVSFSKTLTGNSGLDFRNGWVSYSARAARVGKYGDVVRFQGAVKNGTARVIAVLPTSMRPPKDVYLVAGVSSPVPATLLVKSSNGEVSVEGPPLNVAATMTTLDGVSFAL